MYRNFPTSIFSFFVRLNYTTNFFSAKNNRTEGSQMSDSREWLIYRWISAQFWLWNLLTLLFSAGKQNLRCKHPFSNQSSKNENLQSTGNVPLDTVQVLCLDLYIEFRKLLLLFLTKSYKTTDRITSLQSTFRSPRFLSIVHYQRCCIPYLSRSEKWRTCAVLNMFHFFFSRVFVCFFLGNLHHFSFVKFL